MKKLLSYMNSWNNAEKIVPYFLHAITFLLVSSVISPIVIFLKEYKREGDPRHFALAVS